MPPWYDWQHDEPAEEGKPKCDHVTMTIRSVAEYLVRPEKCEKCGYDRNEGWRKRVGKGHFQLVGRGWAKDGYQ